MPASKNYLDPGISYSSKEWPFRSTAFQSEGFTWEFAEYCNQYYLTEETEEEIFGCEKPTWVLTILHKKEESTDVMGTIGQQELVEVGGAQLDAEGFTFPGEPGISVEMMAGRRTSSSRPSTWWS